MCPRKQSAPFSEFGQSVTGWGRFRVALPVWRLTDNTDSMSRGRDGGVPAAHRGGRSPSVVYVSLMCLFYYVIYVYVRHRSLCHLIWNTTKLEFLTWHVYFRFYCRQPEYHIFPDTLYEYIHT